MKVLFTENIFTNPLPQLKSVHSMFPYICELEDGTLLATHTIGEAFESVDSTACVSFSNDGGKTWSKPCPMFDKSEYDVAISDYCKQGKQRQLSSIYRQALTKQRQDTMVFL